MDIPISKENSKTYDYIRWNWKEVNNSIVKARLLRSHKTPTIKCLGG